MDERGNVMSDRRVSVLTLGICLLLLTLAYPSKGNDAVAGNADVGLIDGGISPPIATATPRGSTVPLQAGSSGSCLPRYSEPQFILRVRDADSYEPELEAGDFGPPDTKISFQVTYCFEIIGSITTTIADFRRKGTCSLTLDPDLLITAGWIYCNVSDHNSRLDEIKLQFRDSETALEQLDAEIAKAKRPDFQSHLERALVLRVLERLPEATDDLQVCFEMLNDATPQQILVVTELLRELRDMGNEWAKYTLTAVSIEMFAVHRLERAVQASKSGKFSAGGLERYLSHLPVTSAIPNQVLERLLLVGQFDSRLNCAQRLLQRKSKTALDAVLAWADQGHLTEKEAYHILEESSASFILRCLPDDTPRQWIERLLETATDQKAVREAGLVRPRSRIQCDAGYGRVDYIEDKYGHEKLFCFTEDTDVRLHVTLRPEADAERVVLDTTTRTIHFIEAKEVYTCTKCEHFSACSPNLIMGAHNRQSHGGLGPSYRRESRPVRHLKFLTTRP